MYNKKLLVYLILLLLFITCIGYNDPVLFVLCDLVLEEKQVDCPQNQKDCLLRQGLVVQYLIAIIYGIILLGAQLST